MTGKRWDIFCKIVDNFGVIGICWRLSLQLAHEHHLQVRLWIDDFPIASKIIPQLDITKQQQMVNGIEICAWQNNQLSSDETMPANVVIETFACGLPEAYIHQMVENQSIWINLDYLSAEPWVSDFHAKPSPQPTIAITKHFFFPGFKEDTGGLIREKSLMVTRDAFTNSSVQKTAFWDKLGLSSQLNKMENSIKISLFCYPEANVSDLLLALEASPQPVSLLIPNNSTMATFDDIFDDFNSKNITIYQLPFLSQSDYDKLLCVCDLNFVRGEDSWIRAIWAGKPFIWQPYIQAENTHLKKLDAFLTVFYNDYAQKNMLCEAHHYWSANQVLLKQMHVKEDAHHIWLNYLNNLSAIKVHTEQQAEWLASQTDLAAKLVIFCNNAFQ